MASCLDCFRSGRMCRRQTEYACMCPETIGYGCGLGCLPCGLSDSGALTEIGTSEHGERWIRARQKYRLGYRDGEGIVRPLLSKSNNTFLAPLGWTGEGGVCFDQCNKTECFDQHICKCKWATKSPIPGVTCADGLLVCGTFKNCGHYEGVGYASGAQVNIFCRTCDDTTPIPVTPKTGTSEGDILLQYGEARYVGCISNRLVFCLGFIKFDPGCQTRPQDQHWIEDWKSGGQHLWDSLDIDYGNIHFMQHAKFHHTPEEKHNIEAKNRALDLLRKKPDGMGRLFNVLGHGGERSQVNTNLDRWWGEVNYVDIRGCGNLPVIYSYPKSYLKYLGCKFRADLVIKRILVECSLVLQYVRQTEGREKDRSFVRPAIALKVHVETALHITQIDKCELGNVGIRYDEDCNLRVFNDDLILVTEDDVEIMVPPWKMEWWGTRNAFSIIPWKNIANVAAFECCRFNQNGWQNCVTTAASVNTAEKGGYQIHGMPSRYEKKDSIAMVYGGTCGISITNGESAFREYCGNRCWRNTYQNNLKGKLSKRY